MLMKYYGAYEKSQYFVKIRDDIFAKNELRKLPLAFTYHHQFSEEFMLLRVWIRMRNVGFS